MTDHAPTLGPCRGVSPEKHPPSTHPAAGVRWGTPRGAGNCSGGLPQTPAQPMTGDQLLQARAGGNQTLEGAAALPRPFHVSCAQVLPSAPRQRQQEPEAGGLGVPAAERGVHRGPRLLLRLLQPAAGPAVEVCGRGGTCVRSAPDAPSATCKHLRASQTSTTGSAPSPQSPALHRTPAPSSTPPPPPTSRLLTPALVPGPPGPTPSPLPRSGSPPAPPPTPPAHLRPLQGTEPAHLWPCIWAASSSWVTVPCISSPKPTLCPEISTSPFAGRVRAPTPPSTPQLQLEPCGNPARPSVSDLFDCDPEVPVPSARFGVGWEGPPRMYLQNVCKLEGLMGISGNRWFVAYLGGRGTTGQGGSLGPRCGDLAPPTH